MLNLRLKAKNGQHLLKQMTADSSVGELKAVISSLTNIQVEALKVLNGFPPKTIDVSNNSKTLADLNIRSGDTLIVEQTSVNTSAAPSENDSLSRTIQEQLAMPGKGILMREVVPANNSCLFTSVNYVMEGGKVDLTSAGPMRQIIASVVSSDKTTYTSAFLGKSNSDYCNWIQRNDSWGGAIEISILSHYHRTEIDIVDTQSGRVDRFGEDKNYRQRTLLLYDGIHYDPLKLEPFDPTAAIQTIYATTDDSILSQAMELASEAKASRQFTDVGKFSLRCLICDKKLTGQAEAQEHATKTSHINFGEV